MSFFYRVFTTIEKNIWAKEIESFLEKEDVGLSLCGVVEEEDAGDLDAEPVELIFFDKDDNEVASLVYDPLDDSDFLAEEIEEFQGCIDEMEPECNRAWAHEQLAKTIGCYCFTVHEAGFNVANWDRLATIACWLREETDGIEQSDGGQITNGAGEVILLVPDDKVDDELNEENGSDDVQDFPLNDVEGADVDAATNESDDDVEEFAAAIRVGDNWIAKNVHSEETLAEFLRGEV